MSELTSFVQQKYLSHKFYRGWFDWTYLDFLYCASLVHPSLNIADCIFVVIKPVGSLASFNRLDTAGSKLAC